MKTGIRFQRLVLAALLLASAFPLWGQNNPKSLFTATGTVAGPDGETVIGANVVVKGTANGAITGEGGDFTLPGVKMGGCHCRLFHRIPDSGGALRR